MGVLPGAVRREQPPSLGDSPAEPGLAEERAHAPEERKRKVKERRAGAPVGAPRGCPGAPCVRSLRGRRGRTKAAAALGPLWVRAGRQRLSGSRAAGSLPLSVLRSAFGAAPLMRAASVPLPARESVSALGGSATL